ncbi:MAG: Pre-mRNA-splicing factor [Bathelium mastoideum]|nr:MAG: Pre-mRNA-splicing factor [Bathelium mastoideum]
MAEVDTMPTPTEAPSISTEIQNPLSETVEDPSATALTTTTTTTPDDPSAPKKIKKIVKKKRRPARPQIDPAELKASEPPPQTGTIFNIWYNKWSGGDREDKYLSKHAAPSRCSIHRDSGYTRADRVPGAPFCLHFARGVCPRGADCEFLHRLPALTDIFPPHTDCFGRDKHSDYRSDMGGVGSFLRPNRTLYIGRIHVADDIEEVVARHFAEWGAVERTRVLPARGVAFVTYVNEANAQFAKEAMAHQSLDNSEVLNVRWATVDPNPAAQKREARRVDEQAAEAIRAALPAEYVAEIEGRDPEAKKRRKIEGSFGLQGYEAPDEVWYASEKARVQAERNGGAEALEAPEEQKLIESAPAEDVAEATNTGGGLLSNSTLAALKGYKAGVAPPKDVAKGPLVGYGSDDDSD